MSSKSKRWLELSVVSAVAIGLSFGVSYLIAWTGPASAPPGGNVAAPVNVGSVDQTKSGDVCTSKGGTTKCLSTAGGEYDSIVLYDAPVLLASWDINSEHRADILFPAGTKEVLLFTRIGLGGLSFKHLAQTNWKQFSARDNGEDQIEKELSWVPLDAEGRLQLSGWGVTLYLYGYRGKVGSTYSLLSDTTAPSAPTNLTIVTPGLGVYTLSWSASTDTVGVVGYKVYDGGVELGTTANTTYGSTQPKKLFTYTGTYTVKAYDAAGNLSGPSNSVTFTY